MFVAELGDKSQLLALALATRQRAVTVLAGLALASAALMAVSVSVGGAVSAVVPERAVAAGAGVLFLAFAAWTLFADDDEDEHETAATRRAVLPIAGAFALAELGDKTMLVTFTLAATHGIVGTWVGATLGMVAGSAIAIAVGNQLGARLPERAVRMIAAASFAAFGAFLLVEAIRG